MVSSLDSFSKGRRFESYSPNTPKGIIPLSKWCLGYLVKTCNCGIGIPLLLLFPSGDRWNGSGRDNLRDGAKNKVLCESSQQVSVNGIRPIAGRNSESEVTLREPKLCVEQCDCSWCCGNVTIRFSEALRQNLRWISRLRMGKKIYYVVLVWVGVVDTSHALKRLGQPELQTGAIPSQRVTLIVCSAKSSRKNILVFHGW